MTEGWSERAVVLDLPATTASVAVVRATVASVVARQGATVDDVDDLRVVASEVCTLLVERCADGARMILTVDPGDLDVRLTARVDLEAGAEPVGSTFGWTVLTALTPDVAAEVAGGRLTIDVRHRITVPA